MTNPRDSGSPTGAEEAILAARAAKAEAIRSRGDNPFANDLWPDPLVALGELRQRFVAGQLADGKYDATRVGELAEGKAVHVAGRVLNKRVFGKAAFVRLRDRQGELQLFCKSDSLGAGFDALEDI